MESEGTEEEEGEVDVGEEPWQQEVNWSGVVRSGDET